MDAKISIIVPVYNTAPWLKRCLDSICSQSYRNLEILCINDGSTDNSAEILAEYEKKDSRIKVFTQANAGLSAARNTGLQHATGEWITGVDSDDYIDTNLYETAIKNANENVDVVFFGVENISEDEKLLAHNEYFNLPTDAEYEMTPKLSAKLNACFWSKLWRRSIIYKHNISFPHGLIHEDEAFYHICVPYVKKVSISNFKGYYYVQREGSIMNAALSELEKLKRFIPILEYVYNEYTRRNLIQNMHKLYMIELFARLSSHAYWSKNNKSAALALFEPLIHRSGTYRDDYRLERLLPVRGLKRLFLSRYANSKVFRFLGIPCWANLYSEDATLIKRKCLLLDVMKKVFLPWRKS